MNKKLLTIALICTGYAVNAQTTDPVFTSWMLNETNQKAVYQKTQMGPPPQPVTTVNMTELANVKSIYYTTDNVYINSEGLAGYTMGTWPIPNEPTAKGYTFKIPRNPQEETVSKTSVPEGGPIGVAINGVPFYGYESAESWNGSTVDFNGDNIWNADAWVNEGNTMDDGGGGHPTDQGAYHYHATPFALYGDIGDGHSPIIGWAPDGYPIYGPYGYDVANNSSSSVVRMETGYAKGSITQRHRLPGAASDLAPSQWGPDVSGTYPVGYFVEDYEYVGGGHLDEYNGRECVTPEYPGGTYAYFITIDASNEPEFPYLLAAEYYGTADLSNIGYEAIPGTAYNYTTANSLSKAQEATFGLYPNPATEYVVIDGLLDAKNVKVIDVTGKVVWGENIKGNEVKINTSTFNEGVYHVLIENNVTIQSKALIIH